MPLPEGMAKNSRGSRAVSSLRSETKLNVVRIWGRLPCFDYDVLKWDIFKRFHRDCDFTSSLTDNRRKLFE
jgi:hypothetical protein